MPHLSSATTMTNATTTYSPKQDNLTSGSSSIELAPILNICNSLDNRPPSPDSPKNSFYSTSSSSSSSSSLPSFLEPKIELYQPILQFSLDLFKKSIYHVKKNTTTQKDTSISPTMATAIISAADTTTCPESPAVLTLLKSIGRKRKQSQNKITTTTTTSSVDQSMFLTKNAHIKRPRNAWIHFRCHYGQALKSKDPTLRAEEISKRASEKWSKLTENEKKPWHGLAEQEKLAHREAFPEYRYCPRRSRQSSK